VRGQQIWEEAAWGAGDLLRLLGRAGEEIRLLEGAVGLLCCWLRPGRGCCGKGVERMWGRPSRGAAGLERGSSWGCCVRQAAGGGARQQWRGGGALRAAAMARRCCSAKGWRRSGHQKGSSGCAMQPWMDAVVAVVECGKGGWRGEDVCCGCCLWEMED